MPAIGIDLGTTNSCCAIWRGGQVEVLKDSEGLAITPSVVSARESGEWVAGRRAIKDGETNPKHTYRAVKRLIGRQFEDPQVVLAQETSTFTIAPADNGEAWISGRERLHSPAEIQAHILRRMKAAAEFTLGHRVTEAVITVPAYFNDAQRKATMEAGRIADLKVLRIINEPTAAGLALDRVENFEGQQTVAIYDLGGGTFDLSIVRIVDGEMEVLVSNGDTFLGGEDFDRALVNLIADEFLDRYGVDLRKDIIQLARLREAAEIAKRELSDVEVTSISIPTVALVGDEKRPVGIEMQISREMLEGLCKPYIDRTLEYCGLALEEAELQVQDISRVILVGGQTRMPAVQAAVRALFGGITVAAPDPDQIVARGAAVMAAALTGQMVVDLRDVTPFDIGVQTADDRMCVLVHANTHIPARETRPFTTAVDGQEAVTIRLRQGNSETPGENLPLGRFHLDGVRPTRDGRRIIDVTADIDSDGVVTVSARDRGSGRVQAMTVDTQGLPPRSIDRLRKHVAQAERAQPGPSAA